jgi:hypothetical protein
VRSAGITEALVVEEGAATAMVRLFATGDALTMLMASGFGEHVTPGGEFAGGQVTLTIPVKPPLGVTVMADIPLLPAVTVAAAPLTVNEPELDTVTAVPVDVEVA